MKTIPKQEIILLNNMNFVPHGYISFKITFYKCGVYVTGIDKRKNCVPNLMENASNNQNTVCQNSFGQNQRDVVKRQIVTFQL